MAKDKGLESVTYSRSHRADRELPVTLVGSSQWLTDIELLLEDEWPKLSLVGLDQSVAETITSSGAQLALVEATFNVEETRQCLEATIPASTKKVLLLRDAQPGENPFVRRTLLNLAARAGITTVQLHGEAKLAAEELSNLLGPLCSQVRGDIEADLDRAELILDGFDLQTDVVPLKYVKWHDRSERVTSWLFSVMSLSTTEYRLISLLTKSQPIFEKQSQWPSSITDILVPLQEFSKSTRAKDVLPLALSLIEKIPAKGTASESDIESVLSASTVGVLTKRAMRKEMATLIGGSQNVRKLKEA